MSVTEYTPVVVQRHAGKPPLALYRLGDVEPKAGTLRLDAWVWCDGAMGGALAHSCRHGQPPHRIRVTISSDHNDLATFRALIERVLAAPDGRPAP